MPDLSDVTLGVYLIIGGVYLALVVVGVVSCGRRR